MWSISSATRYHWLYMESKRFLSFLFQKASATYFPVPKMALAL